MNVMEFSKRVGISPHTIRYYDKVGLFNETRRLPNGHRCFQNEDIVWLEFILRLKDTGMTIAEIHKYAELRKKGQKTIAKRQAMLCEHSIKLEQQIKTQQKHLEKLNDKINYYQSLKESK
ncbi:MerR family transcriptional regulator [uncultured Pseudoalteromonas sp.]|uniref:MerR family transcriptional regulator n=1 Tax=uncultured Pseudoalteromonas sp. TaxID=114053 RepID=UPI0025896546|nr:MerR family transcriptional regulator [uncultured Pseudoalteromonas sp.]